MSLTQHQQLYEIIQQSNTPLITFKKDATGDTIAGSLALSHLLKKLGRQAEIISPNFILPNAYKFLPRAHEIKDQTNNLRKLSISFNTSGGVAPEIEHKHENDRFHIILTPPHSRFTKDDIEISDSQYRHDLILTLNTPDLGTLDNFFEENTDFFYHVPIVNIDFSPENEHYGHLNIVNITATSVSEMLYDIIQNMDANLLDEDIATCLLAGMIDKTKSFRLSTVTPKSLNIASQLMAAGAERESIIKNLYQTKTVNALRLWGRILLNLNTDTFQKIAWAEMTEQDFIETSTTEADLAGVIDELITNIPTVEISVLFYQKGSERFAVIKSEKGLDLRSSFSAYNPEGAKNLIKFSFFDAPQNIIEKLKSIA